MTYPPSIEVYHEACDEIRSWMPDWLSQDEFDTLAFEHRPQQKRIVAYTRETVMMPFSGDPNLALLQEMLRHGLVQVRRRAGVHYYRNVEHS